MVSDRSHEEQPELIGHFSLRVQVVTQTSSLALPPRIFRGARGNSLHLDLELIVLPRFPFLNVLATDFFSDRSGPLTSRLQNSSHSQLLCGTAPLLLASGLATELILNSSSLHMPTMERGLSRPSGGILTVEPLSRTSWPPRPGDEAHLCSLQPQPLWPLSWGQRDGGVAVR